MTDEAEPHPIENQNESEIHLYVNHFVIHEPGVVFDDLAFSYVS